MKFITLLVFTLTINAYFCQNRKQVRIIDSASYVSQIDSLKSLFGYNKKIPRNHELSILLALSYYPELDSSRIIFKESKISTTLNARPTTLSLLFRKKTNRKYIVRINSVKKDSLVTLNEVPFNAKIGLFGHEFNHFIDYRKRNLIGVTKRLLAYTNKKSKERFEKKIDSLTIKRGLGWQLYDWSFYVLHKSDAKLEYKKFKRMIYLEPKEISAIIKKKKKAKRTKQGS